MKWTSTIMAASAVLLMLFTARPVEAQLGLSRVEFFALQQEMRDRGCGGFATGQVDAQTRAALRECATRLGVAADARAVLHAMNIGFGPGETAPGAGIAAEPATPATPAAPVVTAPPAPATPATPAEPAVVTTPPDPVTSPPMGTEATGEPVVPGADIGQPAGIATPGGVGTGAEGTDPAFETDTPPGIIPPTPETASPGEQLTPEPGEDPR